MSAAQIAYAARILALVGGILMVIFSALALLGIGFRIPFRTQLADLDIIGRDIVTLVLGVVAIIASQQAGKLAWAVVLIIVGYLGGDIGGLLVLISGILGLVSAAMKHT